MRRAVKASLIKNEVSLLINAIKQPALPVVLDFSHGIPKLICRKTNAKK